MINESEYDGFYVVNCDKCKGGKFQIPFIKGKKEALYCPICGTPISKDNIFKKIDKKIDRQGWSSIYTESCFDY